MTQYFSRHRAALICLGLAVITTALYWPVTHHDFVNVDDPRFIYQNPHVESGLTWSGFIWAFQSFETENWQPLTWLSHMLDCQWYGLNAGGHHLTSLLFHVANSLLLFLWLNGLTQAAWRSALVAAFFAWHPLHVESVAWACERKDVLSTFFWLLALLTYTRYAQAMPPTGCKVGTASPDEPCSSRREETLTAPISIRASSRRLLQGAWSGGNRHPLLFYALTLIFFACGLMSKPMVVTLPCVLLLLDFWPLGRLTISDLPWTGWRRSAGTPPGKLIAEKIPFVLLTVAMSLATLYAQRAGGALSSLGGMPLSARVANTLANYVTYLADTFWPFGLAYVYPYSSVWPVSQVLGAALLLLAATGWFVWRVRREPWLLAGWLWFLGTLIPTIGLVHVGIISRADRYMYIPSIGLFILVVWGLDSLFDRWPGRKGILPLLAGAALIGCLAATSLQLSYWQNSVTIARHAIDVTANNYVAYDGLGRALNDLGLKDRALDCFQEAVRMDPTFPQSQFNLGVVLRERGRLPEAVEHFAAAARLLPDRYETRSALASTLMLMTTDRWDEAVAELSEALRLKPGSAEAHHNLAVALARQGRLTNAIPQFAETVRLDPTNGDWRFDLGLALLNAHQAAAAAAQFAGELKLTPNETKAHFRLAQALQAQDQLADAVVHYRVALCLTPDLPEAATALGQILSAHPEWKTREPLDNAR